MHLIESYATHCGLRIDKPFITEKFFPLNIDKYITFHPVSKPSRMYDYWQEVITILMPILIKEGVKIVQVGGRGEHPYMGCGHVQGQTGLGQTAYLINGGILHLGCDSFPTHIASGYGKKIVSIYGVCSPGNTTPYWGESNDQRLFYPDRKGKAPCYSNEENPKMINNIKPEEIAEAVCDLLGAEFNHPYKTIYLGPTFCKKLVESVPNSLVNIRSLSIDNLIMRMDYKFDEEVLRNQLQLNPCSIITNRSIDEEIIKEFKKRIKEIVYILEEDHDPSFAKMIQKQNIPLMFLTSLEGDELNDIKLDYLDFNPVITARRKFKPEDSEEFKDRDVDKLFYKSTKITLSNEKIYLSKADWENDNSAESTDDIKPVINNDEFWSELEYMTILEKKYDE